MAVLTIPPRAQHAVTREIDGEFVVLDERTGQAHSLSGPAAAVWAAAGKDADVDRAVVAELAALGLLDVPGLTRRSMLKRTGAVAGGVGIASILLPMASAAASPLATTVFDLYTEVASYEAGHNANVASNTSGVFAYFKAGRNDVANTGGGTYTSAQLTATALSYVASTFTNGRWASGVNDVGPAGGTPFNSVVVAPNPATPGGSQGNGTTVRLTVPSAPSGSYSGTGTLNVHAALTSAGAGQDFWIYVTDSSGTSLSGSPIHLTTATPTANVNFTIPQGAAGQVYYVAVTDANNGTTTVQLDVTATFPHT